MLILGIETSCDETSVAVLHYENGRPQIVTNLIASQIEAHQLFGGVVPEIASRQHLEAINPLLETARRQAQIEWPDINLVAVTHGPGLAGALLVGTSAAKALAFAHRIPCLPVNHIEGHIASNFLAEPDLELPMLCLVVSGGHTDLVLMRAPGVYERLGKTRDDAAGEAFDKVARVLGLPLPGGPSLERAAQAGDTQAFRFKISDFEPALEFSYSGLKTAAAQAARKNPAAVNDIAASFQYAALEQLSRNVARALEQHSGLVKTLGVCGGVAANGTLRESLQVVAAAQKVAFVMPDKILCTDNAAMIAAAGYARFQMLPAAAQQFDETMLAFDTHSVLPIA